MKKKFKKIKNKKYLCNLKKKIKQNKKNVRGK